METMTTTPTQDLATLLERVERLERMVGDLKQPETPTLPRLIGVKEIQEILGKSASYTLRVVRDTNFPKPIQPTGEKARRRWNYQEVIQYLQLDASVRKKPAIGRHRNPTN